MESLAAVSLASNVLQFVQFTKHLVSDTIEIHRSVSGSTSERLEAEGIARRLRSFAKQLTPPEPSGSPELSQDDIELRTISKQCVEISDQVLAVLGGLKITPGESNLESFYKALKGALGKDDFQSLQNRLLRLSQELKTTIVPRQVHELQSHLTRMMQQNERLAARREKDIRKLRDELSEEFLSALQKEGDRVQEGLILSSAVKQGAGYSAEQMILHLLRFQTMDERHDSIPPAYRQTYEWIFQSKDYLSWLSGSSSLYWISGKPGSGKSTLMKHIAHHQQTIDRLREWSQGHEVIKAQFYLWSASRNSLMKSQEGLLRSILFQILREAPSLIPSAFPEQWEALTQIQSSRSGQMHDIPGITELMKAFSRVSTEMKDFRLKFCFFLDGLDEYDGRPGEIIKLVQLLCLPSVKICVSSRPWNEFENAFGPEHSTKLYMQEFNHKDIELYVKENVAENGQFQELAHAEGQDNADEVVRYIVKAADGVFLWVYLVVQSLLEGLGNADKLTDLQKRLYSLPTDLDEYFERILFTIDQFYEPETPTMLLVCLAAADTLPLMVYWFIDCLKDNVDYAMNLQVEPITLQQMYARHRAMKKRLMSWSKGLLEDRFVQTGENDALSSSILFNTKVDYLHRTVRDFLMRPERQQRLLDQASVAFNADLSICQGILGMIKVAPQDGSNFTYDGPIANLLEILFRQIRCFEGESIVPQVEIGFLGRLDQTMREHARVLGTELIDSLPWVQVKPEAPTILLGSVEVGQLRYIEHFLDSSKPSDELSASLLYHSLRPQWAQSAHKAHDGYVVTEFLLKRGISATLALESGSTVWESFLDALVMDYFSLDPVGQNELFQQLKSVLKGGADLKTMRTTRTAGSSESAQRIIERLLDRARVDELVELWETEKSHGANPSGLPSIIWRRRLLQRPKAMAAALKVSLKKRFKN